MLFNRSQREGVLVLVLLVAGLFVFPREFLQGGHEFFLLYDTLVMPKDSVVVGRSREGVRKTTREGVKRLELNMADSAALEGVRGIGPYYAGRIVRYREQLGGFCSVRQLKDLNMRYFDVDSLGYLFCVDTTLVVKRDLDSMDFKEVLRHPYLEYEDVRLIFNLKRGNQSVSFSVLEEKKVLPVYLLKKIRPYFK